MNVTVKGQRYIVGEIRSFPGGEPFAKYRCDVDGVATGATRSAKASLKPGTVGRAVWDAVNSLD